MHTYKKGAHVVVINQTQGGRFMIEGWATVVRPIKDVDDQYLVEFEGHKERAERFIDPLAQERPNDFVKKLNEQVAAR
jgi:hypothetical protein